MMHMHQRLCVCTTMRRATRALTRAYDEALAPFGITVQQFAILRDIQRAPSLPRLAEGLVMDRTSLYRALPRWSARACWCWQAPRRAAAPPPSPRQVRSAWPTPTRHGKRCKPAS
jgi:hypothetical protein